MPPLNVHRVYHHQVLYKIKDICSKIVPTLRQVVIVFPAWRNFLNKLCSYILNYVKPVDEWCIYKCGISLHDSCAIQGPFTMYRPSYGPGTGTVPERQS